MQPSLPGTTSHNKVVARGPVLHHQLAQSPTPPGHFVSPHLLEELPWVLRCAAKGSLAMVLPVALPLLLLPPARLPSFVGMHKLSIPIYLTVICKSAHSTSQHTRRAQLTAACCGTCCEHVVLFYWSSRGGRSPPAGHTWFCATPVTSTTHSHALWEALPVGGTAWQLFSFLPTLLNAGCSCLGQLLLKLVT